MLIATSLAATALATSLAAAANSSTLPPLVITVTEMTDVPAALVSSVLEETNAVWRASGVTFIWRRVPTGRLDRPAPAVAAALRIVIGDARGKALEGRLPLGWIRFDQDEPEHEIYISYRNAIEFMEGSQSVIGRIHQMTMLEREINLTRVMGRALAHELGHYLLASKAHTPAGLMQATHTATDFFAYQRHSFAVDASQRQLIAARLRQQDVVVSR